MRYVSWAVFVEGPSDALYLHVLLPRVLRDLVDKEGDAPVEIPDTPAVTLGARGRSVAEVAKEACAARDAYHIVFFHADTGGRGVEGSIVNRSEAYCEAMASTCGWPASRCVTITPRHEMEAWVLADGAAVVGSLGYRGRPSDVGLPSDARAAERLRDPKQVLKAAIETVADRRRAQGVHRLFPAIAQRQQLDLLRTSGSFRDFEQRLRVCLREMRCIQ